MCGGGSSNGTHFLLEYTSNSGTICSSRQLSADCDGGVCVDVFNVTSDCPGDTYIASIRAVNVVGPGTATQNFICKLLGLISSARIIMQCGVAVEYAAFSTRLVNVGVDVSRGISLYQFTNVGNISCSIGYRNDPGCVQESDTDMISVPNGSVLNLTLPRNLL